MDYVNDSYSQPAPQRSGAWFESRLGKLTASKMNRALDRRKDGSDGAQRKGLLWEVLAERMTNIPAPHFVNDAMRWGQDHEPVAKRRYTEITGLEIEDCGLFDHPSVDNLAASPDGLVGADGLVETKCPTTVTHLQWLVLPECPPDYHPQMLIQLACTGRKWVDFVTFDPRLPVAQQIKVWRFEPDQDVIDAMVGEAVEFLARVDAMFDQIASTEVAA